MTIGIRIRELRGTQSRKQFSELLGIHPQTLYLYEKEKRIPEREIIEKICNRLKIDVSWLIFGETPSVVKNMPNEQPTVSTQQTSLTLQEYCAKLEAKLEKVEAQRDELAEENRKLLKENGMLREENATLRERQRKEQASLFDERRRIPPSDIMQHGIPE